MTDDKTLRYFVIRMHGGEYAAIAMWTKPDDGGAIISPTGLFPDIPAHSYVLLYEANSFEDAEQFAKDLV